MPIPVGGATIVPVSQPVMMKLLDGARVHVIGMTSDGNAMWFLVVGPIQGQGPPQWIPEAEIEDAWLGLSSVRSK
jgi:hypothetical protein